MGAASRESLGKRLRRLRVDRGLTQSQLAGERFSAAYISQLESDVRQPSREATHYLAERLAIAEVELTTGQPGDLPITLELEVTEAHQAISRGEFEQAETTLDKVRHEARRFKLTSLEADAEEGLGTAAERQGNTEVALHHFENALALRAEEPVAARVDAVAGQARAIHLLGDVRYAIHLLETYLSVLKREPAPDPTALMRAYSTLVGRYFGAGMASRAIEAAREARRFASEVHDPQQLASMHVNTARALLHEGHRDAALQSLRRARDIYITTSRPHDAAYTELASGIVLADDGKLDDARAALEQAIKLLGDDAALDKARALNELARVERLAGNGPAALRLLETAREALGDESNAQELALNHREFALVLFNDDRALAEKHLNQAVEIFTRTENPVGVATTYRMWGQTLAGAGKTEQAMEALATGLEFVERHA